MATIITADQYMAEILGLPPADIDRMARHMMQKSEVDVTARAYEWVCNWIAEHGENFQKNANPCWGRIDEMERVVFINRMVLSREMGAAGFSLKACLAKWKERGILISKKDGEYRVWTSVNGKGMTCIQLKLLAI